MNKILAIIVLFCLIIPAANTSAFALEAMPLTNDAVNKLNDAIDRIGAPSTSCGNDASKVKAYIETYKRIFYSAGFDYERSIMRVINDIQFDRYRANTAYFTLYGLARDLLRLHVMADIHPKTYLSKDCAELLIELRNIIRSNMKKYGGC